MQIGDRDGVQDLESDPADGAIGGAIPDARAELDRTGDQGRGRAGVLAAAVPRAPCQLAAAEDSGAGLCRVVTGERREEVVGVAQGCSGTGFIVAAGYPQRGRELGSRPGDN